MNRYRSCSLVKMLWVMLVAVAGHLQAQETVDPRRPAAVETAGVPAVPEELAQKLKRYDDIRWATFSSWSPDAKHEAIGPVGARQGQFSGGMLVRTQLANVPQLHRVYEPGGRREQMTFASEPVNGRFVPGANDGAMLISFSEGGNENDQVYCLEPARFTSALLTDGKSRNLLGPIMHSGTRFALGSTRRNGRDTDWYAADCRGAAKQEMLLQANGDFWFAQDWSADGTRLLIQKYVSANESYPAMLDASTKKLTMLPLADAAPAAGAKQAAPAPQGGRAGKPEPASYRSMRFSADGNSVYLTTNAQQVNQVLMRLDLKTGKYAPLSLWAANDVNDVEVDSTTGAVAFTLNVNGRSKLYLLKGDQRRELPLPLGTVGNLEFSPDGRRLGFALARSNVPSEAYSIDLADDKLTRWTYSETGGLDPTKFAEAAEIEFKSFDGRKIPAWIYRPAKASPDKPAPVLIQIHGGPEGQYRPIFSPSVQFYVAEMGLAVICPNVRGSEGYGKEYLKLDDAEKREGSVKDIGALLDWIGTQRDLDASRVAVEGGSYGGYMVLASLMHYGDRIKAGIDIVGIANFITFLENTAAYRRDLRRAEYGDERDPKMRAVFERINPAANADRIRSALLVAHGRNDPRVPFSEAQQIADKVRAQGGTVWTVYADNEGHGFAKRENRDYLRAVSVMFLKQQLGLKE